MDNDKIKILTDKLTNRIEKLSDISVAAGFDGFIDIITRPIATGDSETPSGYFNNIPDFSNFLGQRAGNSSSVELAEFVRKLGGNGPIFANALGTLGVSALCIGALGYPEVENVFKGMSKNCKLVPIAVPGMCTAMEFGDGKIMLALNGEINTMTWELISERAGLDNIIKAFDEAKLIGLFNWSEIPNASEIWQGILDDVLPALNKNKYILFDFSDCARRDKNEILAMLEILAEFGKRIPIVISMNENETKAISDALGISEDTPLAESGELIRQKLSAKFVVFHFQNCTLGFSEEDMHKFKTFRIEEPIITTGAGDNFNAGLSYGLLLDFSLLDAMIIASLTSSYYVANGQSPSSDELIGFISENGKYIEVK